MAGTTTSVQIGPEDHGHRMTLDEFARAEGQPGYICQVKPDEYLKAGVRLYWIIDPRDRTATILTRRGDKWREQKLDSTGVLKTSMLPGFELKLADVFAAVR